MTDQAPPRRRGRPPKPVQERKGANLTFRTRADFRERLEHAAAQSGRSVTEEVELRVERSFDMDRVVRQLDDMCSIFLDNGKTARIFATSLMANISSVQEIKAADGRQIGSQDWSASHATRAGIRSGVMALLNHYAPDTALADLDAASAQEKSDIEKCRVLAEVWAKMATGQADDLVAMVMRQNGAST